MKCPKCGSHNSEIVVNLDEDRWFCSCCQAQWTTWQQSRIEDLEANLSLAVKLLETIKKLPISVGDRHTTLFRVAREVAYKEAASIAAEYWEGKDANPSAD